MLHMNMVNYFMMMKLRHNYAFAIYFIINLCCLGIVEENDILGIVWGFSQQS